MKSISALALAAIVAAPVSAQATKQAVKLDRNKVPDATATPEIRIPSWSKTKLANGAELIVSVKRGLPLVSVTIAFVGGASQYEDPAKAGLASFAAAMLSEGTASRSGDQISDAQQLLGTSIATGIGTEGGSVRFTSLTSKLDGAMELAADMMLNPRFPPDALDRLRAQRLVTITTGRDNPAVIANNVFPKVVYGDEHPYGRVVTEQSIRAITRDDIVAFHKAYFQPGRAVVTIVGDVDPARVRASFDKAFAAWPAGGERPTFAYPAMPARSGTTIWLVDKPKAAQSIFMLGGPGPERNTPDYYAVAVLNRILGGHFQSRLNYLLREVRGFSYGVNSNFTFGKGPGAFSASGSIVTGKSDSALVDFMNELKGVQGGRPFTDDEMAQGKDGLVQSLPGRFASVGGISGAISELALMGLADGYYQDYAKNIGAVTADDLMRVAKKYIDLEHLNILIVGDRAAIEEPLRRTGIAPIVILDLDAKRVNTVVP